VGRRPGRRRGGRSGLQAAGALCRQRRPRRRPHPRRHRHPGHLRLAGLSPALGGEPQFCHSCS
jgi:hypothetical protein